jgi:hypothetical protein
MQRHSGGIEFVGMECQTAFSFIKINTDNDGMLNLILKESAF